MMFITELDEMRRPITTSFWLGSDMKVIDATKVTEVQADGGELAHIINYMENIPYSKNRAVQTWYGDLAKFIVSNW
jgi:hypothetical protein